MVKMFTILTVLVVNRCILILKHQVVHFKYMYGFLYVSYTSIKLLQMKAGKQEKRSKE